MSFWSTEIQRRWDRRPRNQKKEGSEELEKINLEHTAISFAILLLGLFIACVVFTFEVSTFCCFLWNKDVDDGSVSLKEIKQDVDIEDFSIGPLDHIVDEEYNVQGEIKTDDILSKPRTQDLKHNSDAIGEV